MEDGALTLLSLGCGLAGIWLGTFLQRKAEREKDRQDQRIAVYAEFIQMLAHVERTDFVDALNRLFSGEILEVDESRAFTNTLELFNRVHLKLTVFGSEEVISAVSAYYSVEDADLTDRKRAAYTTMLKAMRNDGFASSFAIFDQHVDNMLLRGPIERRKRIHARLAAEASE